MDTNGGIIEQLRREIDELAERVRALQDLEDPQFGKKVGNVTPLPLQRIYRFSLSLDDTFWSETLKITPEEMEYAKQHGKLLSSVRIRTWRSHDEVAIFEKEFDAKEVFSLQSCPRTLHPRPSYEIEMYRIHSSEVFGRNTLWQLPLGPPQGPMLLFSPLLCLNLAEGWALELCAIYGRFGTATAADVEPQKENIFLTVPLNPTNLRAFRVPDDPEDKYDEPWLRYKAEPWDMRYADEDRVRGLSWGLYVLDLQAYQDESGI